MNGRLSLRAAVRQDRTVLVQAECGFPLQVLRPRRTCDGGLRLVVLTPCGGLLDGDELTAEVCVEPGASLTLCTQAATQVHAGRSAQSWSVTVGAGASFAYVPHALVPHAKAVHQLEARVSLASDAALFLSEVIAPGRGHRGERFAYHELRSNLDIWREGQLVARERQLLRPASGILEAQLGGRTHMASAYAFGGEPAELAGVSQLAFGGYCLRALGERACDLEQMLWEAHDRWRARGWSMGFEPTTAGATIQSSAD